MSSIGADTDVTRVTREMSDPLYCIGRREVLICAMLVLANIKIVFVACYFIFCRPKKDDINVQSDKSFNQC